MNPDTLAELLAELGPRLTSPPAWPGSKSK